MTNLSATFFCVYALMCAFEVIFMCVMEKDGNEREERHAEFSLLSCFGACTSEVESF